MSTSTSIPTVSGFPHLILHMDLDRTVMLRDSRREPHHWLSGPMAESCKEIWEPGSKLMSFANFIRESEKSSDVRRKRIDRFIEWLKSPQGDQVEHRAEILQRYEGLFKKLLVCESVNGGIFPSFYALLNTLESVQATFTIALRTCGDHLEEISRSIENRDSLKSRKFRSATYDGTTLFIKDEGVYEGTVDIFDRYLQGGLLAVQDHCTDAWLESKRHPSAGKPFIYDITGHERNLNLSLFFDDAINLNGPSIVRPIELQDDHLKNTNIDVVERATLRTVELFDRRIFQVDAVEALEDDNYFINRVNCALLDAGHTAQLPMTDPCDETLNGIGLELLGNEESRIPNPQVPVLEEYNVILQSYRYASKAASSASQAAPSAAKAHLAVSKALSPAPSDLPKTI